MNTKYKINNEIYNESFVRGTISDFEEVASIELNNGYLIIEGENNIETDEVFNEFMNYLISNINIG